MVTNIERNYLRELAKKMVEYSALPVMDERKKLWYAHNELRGDSPLIVMEWFTFAPDVMPPMKCEGADARGIEYQLVSSIMNHELIDDDKVVPDFFPIYWQISCTRPGLKLDIQRAADSEGREIGYHIDTPIKDITRDVDTLKPSVFSVERESTMRWKSVVDDAIGDILPTRIKNNSLDWFFGLTATMVGLIAMEDMFFAMMDSPQDFHKLMALVTNEAIAYLKWQQDECLLTLNNGNDYAGSGSYGFIGELPNSKEYSESGKVMSTDLWGNMNSQESVGLSPDTYREFMFPYFKQAAEQFGLIYYGCCEPVHSIWDDCLSKIDNLRKVSVSPWCDEEFMGERLQDAKTIYSRKPSPNYIGVGSELDEDAFSQHISRTLKAARGCKLEIIFRDIYALGGDKNKPAKAIKILRRLIEDMW